MCVCWGGGGGGGSDFTTRSRCRLLWQVPNYILVVNILEKMFALWSLVGYLSPFSFCVCFVLVGSFIYSPVSPVHYPVTSFQAAMAELKVINIISVESRNQLSNNGLLRTGTSSLRCDLKRPLGMSRSPVNWWRPPGARTRICWMGSTPFMRKCRLDPPLQPNYIEFSVRLKTPAKAN